MRLVLTFILLIGFSGCENVSIFSDSDPESPVQASILSENNGTSPKIVKEIESARSFVLSNKDDLDSTGLVVASYLERRFAEQFDIDYASALSAEVEQCTTDKFNAPALGLGFSEELPPDNFFISRAFQCQKHPLPSDFWDGVRIFTDDPVGLDQVTFAVQIALEQGCIEDNEYVREVQEHQYRRLYEELSSPDTHVDQAYLRRFTAWLYADAGKPEGAWVSAVRAAQRDNGGWAEEPQDEKADPTTSILALWVLHEVNPAKTPNEVRFVEGKVEKTAKAPQPYELP